MCFPFYHLKHPRKRQSTILLGSSKFQLWRIYWRAVFPFVLRLRLQVTWIHRYHDTRAERPQAMVLSLWMGSFGQKTSGMRRNLGVLAGVSFEIHAIAPRKELTGFRSWRSKRRRRSSQIRPRRIWMTQARNGTGTWAE
jgi:hypothetical protein